MSLQEYVTSAVKTKGEFYVRNPRQFERAKAALADGEYLLTLARRHATRSKRQNAWYWSQVVGLVAEHTGYTHDEIHDIYKAKFLPKHLTFSDDNGEIYGEFVIGGSTRRLNKIEFGEYCESIRRWAAEELHVAIPDPDPDFASTRQRSGHAS